MPTVYLDDCQNLDHALNQLNQKIYRETSTRWYKRRYGYYEKPAVLKRKRKKMKYILSHRSDYLSQRSVYLIEWHKYWQSMTLWLKIDRQEQFSRTGKNAVGH